MRRQRNLHFGLLLVMILTVFPTSTAKSRTFAYTVQSGDSFSKIAQKYYGNTWQYIYITTYNGLSSKHKLEVGQLLKLPDIQYHKIKRGDTYAKLAKHYFGDAQLYSMVTWANERSAKQPLQVGEILNIPFILKHQVGKGEDLKTISKKYYGSDSIENRLRVWNRLSVYRELQLGSTILIPIRDPLRPVSQKKSCSKTNIIFKQKSKNSKSAKVL